jgi:hypothetical protein
MLSANARAAKAIMTQRLREAQREGNQRKDLRQAGINSGNWLVQPASRLLCRLGHFMVALGRKLERYGSAPALSLHSDLGSGRQTTA